MKTLWKWQNRSCYSYEIPCSNWEPWTQFQDRNVYPVQEFCTQTFLFYFTSLGILWHMPRNWAASSCLVARFEVEFRTLAHPLWRDLRMFVRIIRMGWMRIVSAQMLSLEPEILNSCKVATSRIYLFKHIHLLLRSSEWRRYRKSLTQSN